MLTAVSSGAITLNTAVGSANITTTASGAIEVDETDSIELTRVTTADGSIGITAGGPIMAILVTSQTDSVANDIHLTTTAGSISVLSISAGSVGDVSLTSADSIIEDGTESIEVTADMLTTVASGAITLDTAVGSANITTTATGPIDLDETDEIQLENITSHDGRIDVMAGGSITATLVTSTTDTDSNDITLTAVGDIEVGLIDAGLAGDVLVNASAAIIDGGDLATDITGDEISLMAGSGIGAADDAISLAATKLTTTSNSSQHLSESDWLTLTHVDAGSSDLLFYGGSWYLGTGDRVGSDSTIDIQTGATVDLNGAEGDIFSNLLVSGGTLLGEGTVDADLTVTSGLISPGNSSGLINTNNRTFSAGTYSLELDGAVADSGVGYHDELHFLGSVDLGTETALDVAFEHLPNVNNRFVTINNDGTDNLATGTFAGLAEDVQRSVRNHRYHYIRKITDGAGFPTRNHYQSSRKFSEVSDGLSRPFLLGETLSA